MTVRWKEKAITFRLAYIHQLKQDQTKYCRRGPYLDKTKGNFKGIFSFFFPRKSYQSSLDLQPEILHYDLTYIAYMTYIITHCPIEQNHL